MAFLNTNQIWFPTLLKIVGAKSVTEAGNILVGVWIFAAVFVLLVCRNSDRVGERKYHMLATGTLATAAYLCFPLVSASLWATGILVAIAAAAGYAVFMVFWTIPPVFLEARGAAMGIGMISALGQFGGLSGPAVVGWAFHETGSIYIGFTLAAVTIFLGTLLAVFAIPHTRLRRPPG
jgi:ACS family phthalate transporter-like MFS transporter